MMRHFCKEIGKSSRIRKKALMEHRISIIRRIAHEIDQVIAKDIIKNVCYGTKYEYLNVPCGRRYFYELRRCFFVKLYYDKEFMEYIRVNKIQ